MSLLPSAVLAAEWFPVPATMDGKPGLYSPLPRAASPWRICVLLPHARDKYWWGVSWGLMEEADRLGLRIGIYQAGGYEFLDTQRAQFISCIEQKADAIVLGAISADGLNKEIDIARAKGIPVIDLVNGVTSKAVTARSLVDFGDMANAALRYLVADAGGRPIKVLWLPGPKDAGWVNDAEVALRQRLAGLKIELVHGGYAPPDASSQMALVRRHVQAAAPDYVLGNAVAAEVAANYAQYQAPKGIKVVAYYATEPVVEMVKAGRVLAAPSDGTILQARISLDLAVRAIEKKPHPFKVSPAIEVLDAQSVQQYDLSRLLAPPFKRFTQRPLPPPSQN
ncbi:TMAO reductase system periplasmic protein TorT [Pseudoduganella sp. OTU4001]|uniref:TMAO reductase system periplasmic protein TorT n=1 Tax=Pseudoduganella sp. OTU4001 TaxID=3043854 RepID=UPI00313A9245